MRKSRIKNYNKGAKLQNGLKMDVKQGFADTEDSYFNADGTGTVIGTVKASSFFMGGQDSYTQSPIIGSLWDKDLGQATDTAVLELEEGIFTILVLVDAGAVWQISILAPNGSEINSDQLKQFMELQPNPTIDVFLGSTYVPEGTDPTLPSDVQGVAELYFNDANNMNKNCAYDYSSTAIKNYLGVIGWQEATGGNYNQMSVDASDYIDNFLCNLEVEDATDNNDSQNQDPILSQATQFQPVDREGISSQVNELENNLVRYEKVTQAAKQALTATKNEYDLALQACDDDTNQDRNACTDANDLGLYVEELRTTISTLQEDTSYQDLILTALENAEDGVPPTAGTFTADIQTSLETLASTISTGGNVATNLNLELEQIFNALDDAREALEYDQGIYPDGSPHSAADITKTDEALEAINYIKNQYNGLYATYGFLVLGADALQEQLDQVKVYLNELVTGAAATDENSVFGIQDAIDDIESIEDTIETLSTFQTEIQDLGAGQTPTDIGNFIIELQNAETDLEQQILDFNNAVADILVDYPPTGEFENTLTSVEQSLLELTDSLESIEISLSAYEALGTTEDFQDAISEAGVLASILGLFADSTPEGIQAQIQQLINDNNAAQQLISDVLTEIEFSTEESIVSDLSTLVSELSNANTQLETLNNQVTQQAADNIAMNLLNTELNTLNEQLGSDLTYYQSEIDSIALAVTDLGVTVDELEAYLTQNYGYAEDGTLSSGIPGLDESDVDADEVAQP